MNAAPPGEDDAVPSDEIRPADAVARRALVVFAMVGLALGAPRDEVTAWLADSALDDTLTPCERAFRDNPAPPRQLVVDFGWQAERVAVLLWALGHVAELPLAVQQCDPGAFQTVLPPFADVSVPAFIAGASLRPDAELWSMADTLMDLHWHARDAKIAGRVPAKAVNLEIVQERHHAINWITGYDGLAWDEVTTDT